MTDQDWLDMTLAEHEAELDELAAAVACDGCGDLIRGNDLHACPRCGDVICDRCAERVDDLFYGWCKWCARGGES